MLKKNQNEFSFMLKRERNKLISSLFFYLQDFGDIRRIIYITLIISPIFMLKELNQVIHFLKKSSLFILLGAVFFLFFILSKKEISKVDEEFNALDLSRQVNSEEFANEEDVSPVPNSVIVDVKGEVEKPGVYEVSEQVRVNDVIQKAGGFTTDADQTQVNLAQKVQDEMIIFIPSAEGDIENGGDTVNVASKLRINYASQEEIENLNGIGPSKAKAIIQYREENGLFQSTDDLLNVSGIGESTLENIKDEIQLP